MEQAESSAAGIKTPRELPILRMLDFTVLSLSLIATMLLHSAPYANLLTYG
jgi:hypothetical protein